MSADATAAPRAFLLLGQGGERQFHNQPAHWAALAAVLRGADLRARVISDDPADLNDANLARFDVILNFASSLEQNEEQIGALLRAVEGGIGFVGLHGATTTFRTNQPYIAMVGSRFSHHPPLGHYTVERIAQDHPVTAGLEPFTLEDELYHLADVADDIRVLAWAEEQPMVYVRQHGAGRVCYIAPGHDQRAIGRPEYARLVNQAIAWAARRNRT
jgi:type 1 glutamine amidotransferase